MPFLFKALIAAAEQALMMKNQMANESVSDFDIKLPISGGVSKYARMLVVDDIEWLLPRHNMFLFWMR